MKHAEGIRIVNRDRYSYATASRLNGAIVDKYGECIPNGKRLDFVPGAERCEVCGKLAAEVRYIDTDPEGLECACVCLECFQIEMRAINGR